MRKWLLVSMLALLSACSSTDQQKNYYQLPLSWQISPVKQTALQQQGKHLLWLEQVRLADFLAGNGLVYQTSEVNYSLANNNLWASPLEQQLASMVVDSLNSLLPDWLVSTIPVSGSADTLNISITGFHGRYDGQVIVSGEWLLTHQQQVIKQPFYISLPQPQDGYPAMVIALAQAWRQQVQEIASSLQQLH